MTRRRLYESLRCPNCGGNVHTCRARGYPGGWMYVCMSRFRKMLPQCGWYGDRRSCVDTPSGEQQL